MSHDDSRHASSVHSASSTSSFGRVPSGNVLPYGSLACIACRVSRVAAVSHIPIGVFTGRHRLSFPKLHMRRVLYAMADSPPQLVRSESHASTTLPESSASTKDRMKRRLRRRTIHRPHCKRGPGGNDGRGTWGARPPGRWLFYSLMARESVATRARKVCFDGFAIAPNMVLSSTDPVRKATSCRFTYRSRFARAILFHGLPGGYLRQSMGAFKPLNPQDLSYARCFCFAVPSGCWSISAFDCFHILFFYFLRSEVSY
ncbi:hypothetical protein BV25DRAFT_593549 [Artomyces pyxidatus]|uniref:Uncharacterized protein n=1 Tax=Artomyces pyxidatus TaxID=48021 RepID=A0ACB8T1F9_9AGAM|nr:hypothetical protein BV25DRAFT_593549 [Artomyces pyxidatus]